MSKIKNAESIIVLIKQQEVNLNIQPFDYCLLKNIGERTREFQINLFLLLLSFFFHFGRDSRGDAGGRLGRQDGGLGSILGAAGTAVQVFSLLSNVLGGGGLGSLTSGSGGGGGGDSDSGGGTKVDRNDGDTGGGGSNDGLDEALGTLMVRILF